MNVSRKRPTAGDRPQFRRDVAKVLDALGAEIGEAAPDATILCAHAEDFDPADNVLWELHGNKSAVRADVKCSECKSAVAMSNHTYSQYASMDKKPRVCCTRCVALLVGTGP